MVGAGSDIALASSRTLGAAFSTTLPTVACTVSEPSAPETRALRHGSIGPTSEKDERAFDEGFGVNVRAPYLLTALLAPKMAVKGGAAIVNVSSAVAKGGRSGIGIYSASKAALETLTRTWAVEFAATGVRVNAVSPGAMLTSKVVGIFGDDAPKQGGGTPLGRSTKPDEIAEVVLFFASPPKRG
jgi:NAD(P)-dependent dehydrogenase (short-subunit alcohol dehydrogenase family)